GDLLNGWPDAPEPITYVRDHAKRIYSQGTEIIANSRYAELRQNCAMTPVVLAELFPDEHLPGLVAALHLDPSYMPAVEEAVRQSRWKRAADAMAYIYKVSLRLHRDQALADTSLGLPRGTRVSLQDLPPILLPMAADDSYAEIEVLNDLMSVLSYHNVS